MIKEKNFNIMCSEVLAVLENCPKSDVEKIPTKMITLLNNNKDINHKVEINPNKSIFEQNIIDESIIMIFIIFRNYWASQKEKEEIDKILNENEIKFNDFYAYDKMFNQNNSKEANTNNKSTNQNSVIQNQENDSKNVALVEYKESFIKKFIKAIKEFFKK